MTICYFLPTETAFETFLSQYDKVKDDLMGVFAVKEEEPNYDTGIMEIVD
jgi:hypothetical protein